MGAFSPTPIHGRNGDLISVRILTDARHLEDLLDTLSSATFPVNPQLWHHSTHVTIEFPAWDSNVEEVRMLLRNSGFADNTLRISPALAGAAAS